MDEDVKTEENTPEEVSTSNETSEETPQTEEKTVPYERFKEVNEKYKALQEKSLPVEADSKSQDKPDSKSDSRIDDIEEALSLRDEGYSTSEINAMRNFAKGAGKRASEVKDDPFVKQAIKGLRANKEVEDATPQSSSQTFGQKLQQKRDTFNELSSMTPEERIAHQKKSRKERNVSNWRENRNKK